MNLLSKLFVVAVLCGTFQNANAQAKVAAPVKEELTSDLLSALKFRSIGPAMTSGRIADFAVNPNNHSEYFVAAASGGVWKTTNHGVTFQPVFEGQGSYSIGCVTIDPSQTNTVWVGSGENNNQRSVAYGDGVYKSEDGGNTWKNMGLKSSEHISEIIIHPSNPEIIYVGAYGPVWSDGGDRGVYKSVDGGNTWTCVKSVSAYTGCNDLVMDPRNPEILYASFHQRMRKVFTYIGGGPESAIYKTVDGGKTWKKMEGGLPGGDIGRMGLAISPVNPDVLYTVVEAPDGKGGIYRTVNAGASWEKMSGFFTSGNYYQEIVCDPILVDRIFITDTYYKVSNDGGVTVNNLGEINKHIDNHCIWIDPSDGNHLLVGCDGGVYETWDFAGSWEFKENLPVIQYYKVATDNAFPFYNVHGGTQDNLSHGGPSRTTSVNGIVNSDWFITSIGDGFESQVDPTNPDIIYAQSQYGGLVRYDKKSGESVGIRPMEGENDLPYRWNWDAPLLISQHSNTRLYCGANRLFRTDDRGNSWKVISPDLSRQIDRNKLEIMGKVWSVDAIAKNGSTDIYGQLTSIAESRFDENMIWVGTDDGLIQLTTDGGKSWTKMDNLPGVPPQSYVHQIIASLHDKNTAYVCFNHHRYGNFKPYVLKTTDAGKTWKGIQSNLPVRGSVYSIAEDHVDSQLLFVGTDFGIFVTVNGGQAWTQLKSGLPTIAVRDIEIQRRENDLVLATFGRGFYILDDYSMLRNFKIDNLKKAAMIFPIKDSWMFLERKPIGLPLKGHMGSSYFTAENPPVGAVFTYYVKDELKSKKQIRKDFEKEQSEKKQSIYYPTIDSLRSEDNAPDPYLLFIIKDMNGHVVRQLQASGSSGIQKIVWDFRYATPAPVNSRYTPADDELFGGSERGHLALPGDYTVSLSKYENGILTELVPPVSFKCKLLEHNSLPGNMKETIAFCEKVADIRRAESAAGGILQQMNDRITALELASFDMQADVSGLLQNAHAIRKEIADHFVALYGDGARSSREFETLPSINGRISAMEDVAWNTTSSVPSTQIDSYTIASKQLSNLLEQMKITDARIVAIEKEIELNAAPHTPGRWPVWKGE